MTEHHAEGRSTIGAWLRWKRAHELVRIAVVADVTAASGTPEPELTVLVELSWAGGTLRQNAISARTGWDRTRVSHLLTRMESRGTVRRDRIANGVEVHLEPAGRALLERARPGLESAVQRHLLDRLDAEDRAVLDRILTKVLDAEEPAETETAEAVAG